MVGSEVGAEFYLLGKCHHPKPFKSELYRMFCVSRQLCCEVSGAIRRSAVLCFKLALDDMLEPKLYTAHVQPALPSGGFV